MLPFQGKRLAASWLSTIRGDEIVTIGDGPAEIRAAKPSGTLGVASDEIHQDGRVKLKRDHLVCARQT